MGLKTGLIAQLKTITGIANRVFPGGKVPQGQVAPYIVLVKSGGAEYDALDGWTGLHRDSYELNMLESTNELADSLADSVITKLKAMQGATHGSAYIQDMQIDENSPELYEEQINLYRKIINITVIY
jgi:hypothetical protein